MLRRQNLVTVTGSAAPRPPRSPDATVATGRTRLILQELANQDAEVTFTGLRRRLGVHPQSLTRELRRLEQDELIERTPAGYRLRDQGASQIADGPQRQGQGDMVEILRLVLPANADPETIAALLSGRWFGDLRWYGRADGPNEHVLLWLAEPASQLVRVRMVAGTLLIEAEGGADATVALLAAIAQAL